MIDPLGTRLHCGQNLGGLPLGLITVSAPLRNQWGEGRDSHPADEGCEFSPSCLTCSLPVCRYDAAPKVARAMFRWQQIAPLLAEGLTADEVAARLDISRRTVFRLRAKFGRGEP